MKKNSRWKKRPTFGFTPTLGAKNWLFRLGGGFSAVVAMTFFFSSVSHGDELQVFERRWTDTFPKVPNLSSEKSPKKLSRLSRLKWYQDRGQWDRCLQTSKKLLGKHELDLWIASVHLQCLNRVVSSRPKKDAGRLILYFNQIGKAKALVVSSPFSAQKKRLIHVYLEIAKRALAESEGAALSFLNLHYDLLGKMTDSEKAIYYDILGEVSLRKGDSKLAGQNFLRSYKLSPDSNGGKKLKTLGLPFEPVKKVEEKIETLSTEEDGAWRKVQRDKKGNRYVSLAKTGVEYLNKFPGAPRAPTVAKSLLSSLRRVVYKRQKKFIPIKNDVLEELKKAPGKYVMRWVESIYGRGYYSEALQLAESAVREFQVAGSAAAPLLFAGRSAYFIGKWDVAEKHLKTLTQKYPGAEPAFEGIYYLGMLYFRKKDFTAVIPLYEKFLQSPGSDKWELQVRYWLWRALQKIESPRVALQEKVLLKKFPLTYYGLRVRWETKKNLQSLLASEFDTSVSVKYWWPQSARDHWSRGLKLLAAGWVKEAGSEFGQLPEPQSAEGHLLRAQVWDVARSSIRTIKSLSAAIDLNPELLSRRLLKMAFPQKHMEAIDKYGQIHEMDRDLILAVIRQESGFITDAVSPSRAVGLMQLVPGTAKETAKWIRLKGFRYPDSLLDPTTNIRMGTHYMRRMIKKYRGVVPLAMAAYNVGPGNMDRWLRQRSDLNWRTFGAEVEDDLWMDELPWGETRFYAKAILRNYLLYKIIFSKEDRMSIPAWNGAQSMIPYGKSS